MLRKIIVGRVFLGLRLDIRCFSAGTGQAVGAVGIPDYSKEVIIPWNLPWQSYGSIDLNYTAPSDGWFFLYKNGGFVSFGSSASSFNLRVNGHPVKSLFLTTIGTWGRGNADDSSGPTIWNTPTTFIPVAKGDMITLKGYAYPQMYSGIRYDNILNNKNQPANPNIPAPKTVAFFYPNRST